MFRGQILRLALCFPSDWIAVNSTKFTGSIKRCRLDHFALRYRCFSHNDMSRKTFDDATTKSVHEYCIKHSTPIEADENELVQKTLGHPRKSMLGSWDEIRFLASLCRAMGAKKTLDIGVFTGFSSLCVAKVLPPDGKVFALDVSDQFYEEFCDPAWKKSGVREKIDFRVAPAADTLKALIADGHCGTFDFAFIDADKGGYKEYYELCLQLLRPGGMIAIDNVIWNGHVLEEAPTGADTIAIKALNDYIKDDSRVTATMLWLGDGTTIAVKK